MKGLVEVNTGIVPGKNLSNHCGLYWSVGLLKDFVKQNLEKFIGASHEQWLQVFMDEEFIGEMVVKCLEDFLRDFQNDFLQKFLKVS